MLEQMLRQSWKLVVGFNQVPNGHMDIVGIDHANK